MHLPLARAGKFRGLSYDLNAMLFPKFPVSVAAGVGEKDASAAVLTTPTGDPILSLRSSQLIYTLVVLPGEQHAVASFIESDSEKDTS